MICVIVFSEDTRTTLVSSIGMLGGFMRGFAFDVKITIFFNLGFFRHFETVTNIKVMDKITQILENVVRCKYFEH